MKRTQTTLFLAGALLVTGLLTQCSKSSDNPDPADPAVLVNPITANEGTGPNTSFNFEFRLSAASDKPVSFTVSTEDGTARAGDDFVAQTGTIVSFAPGETTKTLAISIVADEWKENNEDFRLRLTNGVNCSITTPRVSGFIQNDDNQIFFEDVGLTSPTSYPGYTLVWADEFNGSALNTSDWNYEVGDGCPNVCGWGNNELEWYTNGSNLYMQRGKLIIEARQESIGGKNFTSSRITTQNKKSFQYGRIDIRAKTPVGRGIWPALWMLGNNITTVSWPACGEMDIMELLGQEPQIVHATVHFATPGGPRNISKSITKTGGTFSDAFHVYSLVWEEDRMQFYVDDQLINDISRSNITPNNYPFNAPFFFIFNIAVGGNWPGSPDATTVFPQWMFVDYVRVFQR
jgi:beta-glucanase (GH16 family)